MIRPLKCCLYNSILDIKIATTWIPSHGRYFFFHPRIPFVFYRCYTLVHTFSLDFFDIQRDALCTKEVYEGTILRQQNGFKQGSEVRLITSASYSRRPFMSLMRERIILQLQLTTPGKVSMTVCRNVSISSPEAATA